MTPSENASEIFWDSTNNTENGLAEISIEDNPLFVDSDTEDRNYKHTLKLELLQNPINDENLSDDTLRKIPMDDNNESINSDIEDENYKLNLRSKLLINSNHNSHYSGEGQSTQKSYDLKILKVELKKLPDKEYVNAKDSNRKDYNSRRSLQLKKKPKNKELFSCPKGCGGKFYFARTLRKHLTKVCGYSARYQCPRCEYKKKNRYEVTKHIKRRHESEQYSIFPIDLWGINTAPLHNASCDEDAMEKLMKTKLLESIQFSNADSEIKISNVSSLATRDDVKPNVNELALVKNPFEKDLKLPCTNKCGAMCKNLYSLNSHIRYECQKLRFKCPYCASRSKYSRNILSHVKLLHSERSEFAIDTLTKRIFGSSDQIRRSERLSAAQIT